jgi:hypothetical protein
VPHVKSAGRCCILAHQLVRRNLPLTLSPPELRAQANKIWAKPSDWKIETQHSHIIFDPTANFAQ